MNEEYTAVLKNWSLINEILTGDIYHDKRGRFADGDSVRTSSVMGGPNNQGIVVTRNSVYKLEPYPFIGETE